MDSSILDQILTRASHLQGTTAYAVILGVLLACGLGVPIPEDVTLITAGYLSHLGNINVYAAVVICMVGVLAGDLFLFFLGRRLGKRAFKLPILRSLMTPDRIHIAEEKLKQNSKKVMFTARFLAGFRAPIYLTAGILNVRPVIFLMMDTLAALISVPALVMCGYFFGDEIDIALLYARKAERYIVIGLAVIGAYVIIKSILGRRTSKIE